MTKTQINTIKRTLNAVILMQLDLIDQFTSPFIRDNKMRLNNTISWLKSISESFTTEVGCETEIDNYNAISDELRKTIREFGLEFEASLQLTSHLNYIKALERVLFLDKHLCCFKIIRIFAKGSHPQKT